jgi:hypothetical protein
MLFDPLPKGRFGLISSLFEEPVWVFVKARGQNLASTLANVANHCWTAQRTQ